MENKVTAKGAQLAQSWKAAGEKIGSGFRTCGSVYAKIKYVIGVIVKILYHLRKVALAAPVVYFALKLASYNMQNLPEQVGINLQSTGEFADFISRNTAVMGPLVVTGACLVMMFCSRKALYSWAISVFTLALPILLLVSNLYPA